MLFGLVLFLQQWLLLPKKAVLREAAHVPLRVHPGFLSPWSQHVLGHHCQEDPDIERWPCSSWTETTKLRGSDVWLDRPLRGFSASSCKARHAFHSWASARFPLPSKSGALFTLDLCCVLGLWADKSVLPHCTWTQWDYAIACLNLPQELLVSPWDYTQGQKK